MSFTSFFTQPAIFIVWLLSVVIALTVHEFSHALAATLQGDDTAKRMGRLTLNPFSHMDLFGVLALVFVHFGWGKPVPFNPYHLRNKTWGAVYVGIAGPISNLILLTVSAVLLRLLVPVLGGNNLLIVFLAFSFFINTSLMLFNLIPLPPLDGSKLLLAVLRGHKWDNFRYSVEYYGPYVLMVLILLDVALGAGLISLVIDRPLIWIMNLFGINTLF